MWMARQFAGAIEPGQLIGIAAVGLDAVGGFLWESARGDDLAVHALAAQMAAQDKAARAGFINQAQLDAGRDRVF